MKKFKENVIVVAPSGRQCTSCSHWDKRKGYSENRNIRSLAIFNVCESYAKNQKKK